MLQHKWRGSRQINCQGWMSRNLLHSRCLHFNPCYGNVENLMNLLRRLIKTLLLLRLSRPILLLLRSKTLLLLLRYKTPILLRYKTLYHRRPPIPTIPTSANLMLLKESTEISTTPRPSAFVSCRLLSFVITFRNKILLLVILLLQLCWSSIHCQACMMWHLTTKRRL